MAIKYLDAKRIRGSSTASPTISFSDSFTSDNWTDTDTKIAVDTGNARMALNIVRDGTDDKSVYDLGVGNVSETAWVLRYDVTFTTINNSDQSYFFTGLSDTVAATGDSADRITLQYRLRATSGEIIMYSSDTDNAALGGTVGDNNAAYDLVASTTYYVTMTRTSATAYTIKIRSGSHTGTLRVSLAGTVTSSVDNLRYIIFQTFVSNGSGSSIGYIDNVKFYNGITDADDVDEKATLGSKADLGITFDFTSATGWVTYNHETIGTGAVTIDSSTDNRVEGVSVPQHERDRVVYDLGQAVSDTEWTLDFDMNCSAIATHRAFIPCGLSSIPDWNNSTTDDNAIGIYFNDNSGTKYFQSIVNKGGAHQSEEGTQALSLDTTYYARLKRNSDTSITISYYPNASTRTANGTPTYTDEQTITTGVIDLRYIIIGSGKYGNSPETVSFTVDNVKLVATAKNTTFDLPENALFEETDTYKTYWLQDSIWKDQTYPYIINPTTYASTSGWSLPSDRTSESATLTSVDTTNNGVTFNLTTSTTDEGGLVRDLGENLGSQWACKFKVEIDDIHGNDFYFLNFTTGDMQPFSSSNESINIQVQGASYWRFAFNRADNGSQTEDTASNSTASEDTTYYCTVIRDGNNVSWIIRTGSYSGSIVDTLVLDISGFSGNIRYLQHTTRGNNSSEYLLGWVRDLHIQNGVTTI